MKIKGIILFFFLLLVVAATGFAENLVIENQTPHPMKDQVSKIVVQWANSAREVEEGNSALMYGSPLNPNTVQVLIQSGKNSLSIPEKAQYFRVLVWSKGGGEPDFLTNWVDVVPNKTYTLDSDHLVPIVLMFGIGC